MEKNKIDTAVVMETSMNLYVLYALEIFVLCISCVATIGETNTLKTSLLAVSLATQIIGVAMLNASCAGFHKRKRQAKRLQETSSGNEQWNFIYWFLHKKMQQMILVFALATLFSFANGFETYTFVSLGCLGYTVSLTMSIKKKTTMTTHRYFDTIQGFVRSLPKERE